MFIGPPPVSPEKVSVYDSPGAAPSDADWPHRPPSARPH
jgi:hypothetical protein